MRRSNTVIWFVGAVIGSLSLMTVSARESPRGVSCCELPTKAEDVEPLTEPLQCSHFCPYINPKQVGFPDGTMQIVFRGGQKTGTSVSLMVLNYAIPQLLRILGYNVSVTGNRPSWGFIATIHHGNKTASVDSGISGMFYKHGASLHPSHRVAMTMRDPRDAMVSVWHHHAPGDPIPKDWTRSSVATKMFRMAFPDLVHSFCRFADQRLIHMRDLNGLLVLDFVTATRDIPGSLLQVLELMEVDTYANDASSELKPGMLKVLEATASKFDRSAGQAVLTKINATSGNVPIKKTRGMDLSWVKYTHFNGGLVGRYKTELSESDIKIANGVICNMHPILAGIYGVEGCTEPPRSVAGVTPLHYRSQMQKHQ